MPFYTCPKPNAWSIPSLPDYFVGSMAQNRNLDIFALGDKIAR
jgi:hypothetical protein